MRTYKFRAIVSLSAALFVVLAHQNCSGFSADKQVYSESSIMGVNANLSDLKAYGETGLRRLTQVELSRSLTDIFGIAPADSDLASLPADGGGVDIFDNDYKSQGLDSSTADAFEAFSENYASTVAQNSKLLASLAGCTASSATDSVCFDKFVKKVGRRLMRRPLSTAEVALYDSTLMPFAKSENRYATAVEMFLSSMLQNPEVLYRVEREINSIGSEPVYQLTDNEIASRISFFVTGLAPDDVLLDLADSGQLHDPAVRAAQAQRLLAKPEARFQFGAFHDQWFGYADQSFPSALKTDLFAESKALYDRVVFVENRNWLDIFTMDQTYVTPNLATYYGFPAITKSAWVSYPAERGGGILSHGTLAVMGAKFGDTSPTLRGYNLYKRVMCQKLGPVPAGVDVNNAPGSPTDCKTTRYSMRTVATCASCHAIIDGIGFGLERIGAFGEWRTSEPSLPQCAISDAGVLDTHSFAGPRDLGSLFHDDSRVSQCAVTQLFRFMSGRLENSDDSTTLEALNDQLKATSTLSSLITELVKSPGIMYHQQGRF